MEGESHQDQDDGVFFEPSLFEPDLDSFVQETFQVLDIHQPLLVSKACTTDYHLTGTIVWPVSQLLAFYLASVKELVKGKTLLEIGAGCGLAGFVSCHLEPSLCVVSDGEELVVKIIEKNIALVKETVQGHVNVESLLLRWGEEENVADYRAKGFAKPDLVVGADVFHPSFGCPEQVFELVTKITEASPSALFICGYVDRKNKEDVFRAAQSCGFAFKEVPAQDFLPFPMEELSAQPLQLFVFSPQSPAA